MGLDQFLQAPKEMSSDELSALRDGLIQVLSMIQTEIIARPPESAAGTRTGSTAFGQAMEKASNEATDRIIKMNAPAAATASSDSGAIPIEQDLKLAIGLLLKHRGGPGFGHGRLQGKELTLMSDKLRSVSRRLLEEAEANRA